MNEETRKGYRLALGMQSAVDVDAASGVGRNKVYAYEKHGPAAAQFRVYEALNLAKLYGISLGQLLEDPDLDARYAGVISGGGSSAKPADPGEAWLSIAARTIDEDTLRDLATGRLNRADLEAARDHHKAAPFSRVLAKRIMRKGSSLDQDTDTVLARVAEALERHPAFGAVLDMFLDGAEADLADGTVRDATEGKRKGKTG